MDYPKLWNGPHPVGEALVRALQRTGAPFLSAEGVGVTAATLNGFAEVKHGAAKVEAGFIFRRQDEATYWGLPNTTVGQGTPFGTQELSRLTTTVREHADLINDPRGYRFRRRSKALYGAAGWYGKHKREVLSWDASTVEYISGVTGELYGLARRAGYAGTIGVGDGTKVYHKGRVVLDLAATAVPVTVMEDPEYAPSVAAMARMSRPVTAYRIHGAALAPGALIAALAYLPDGAGANLPAANGVLDQYAVFFVRFRASKRTVSGEEQLRVSPHGVVLDHIDMVLAQGLRTQVADMVEAQCPPGFFSFEYGATHDGTSPYQAAMWVPLTDWHFNASGTRARVLLTRRDLSSYEGVVLEFVAPTYEGGAIQPSAPENPDPPGVFVRKARHRTARSPGDGVECTPGGRIYDVAETRNVTSSDGDGFSLTSTNTITETTFQVFGFLLGARYRGDAFATAEIQCSRYRFTEAVTHAISRPVYPTWVESKTAAVTFEQHHDLVFHLDNVEQARVRFLSLEYVYEETVAGEVATRAEGARYEVRYPGIILHLDAAVASAMWVEIRVVPTYPASRPAPVDVIAHPVTGDPLYGSIDDPVPTSFQERRVLRRVLAGVELAEIVLGQRTLSYLDPSPLSSTSYIAFPPVGETTAATQGMINESYILPHCTTTFGSLFFAGGAKNQIIYRNYTSDPDASGASIYDASLLSATVGYLTGDNSFLPVYPVAESGVLPNDPAYVSDLTNGNVLELTQLDTEAHPWLHAIGIY